MESITSKKVLLPELIEAIATYLQTASDMFLLLNALPEKHLTRPLSSLKLLMFVQSFKDSFDGRHIYYRLDSIVDLWPHLNHFGSFHPDDVELINNSYTLYSSISIKKLENLFDLPHTNAKIKLESLSGFELGNVKVSKTQNLYEIMVGLEMRNNPRRVDAKQFCTSLNSLHTVKKALIYQFESDESYLKDVIHHLKTSTHLDSLTISVFVSNPLELDETFVRDLAALAKKLKEFTIVPKLSNPALFCQHFEGCTEWLLQHSPGKIAFSHGCVSQAYIKSDDIDQVTQNIKGLNLSLFRLCSTLSSGQGSMINLLKTLGTMGNLRKLWVDSCKLDARSCQQLVHILPRLEEFTLEYNPLSEYITTDPCAARLIEGLSKCTRLQQLTLNGLNLSAKFSTDIAAIIARGSPIRHLNLRSNKLGDEGAAALSRVLCKLDIIDLTHNRIGYEGAISISKVINDACHVSVALNCNNLTSAGVKTIISSLKSSRISKIGLAKTYKQKRSIVYGHEIDTKFDRLPGKKMCNMKLYDKQVETLYSFWEIGYDDKQRGRGRKRKSRK